MIRPVLFLVFTSLFGVTAALGERDYLPSGTSYDADAPEPSAFFGHEIGDWHLRHDRLVSYYQALADASPRVLLEYYGRTHEGRPLLILAISSPGNLSRLDAIEAQRRAWREGAAEAERPPLAVWLAYSVHGNESSGANAAPLMAYYLAANRGEETQAWLEETVFFIDPCLNPDGMSRFAQWANSFRGSRLVGDSNHFEHNEGWPGGRGNHYWFDLNRDWLLLTHPESWGRVSWYQRWRPNILTDFHEMGSDSTYFFQPGVPARQNPNTPSRNLELTRRIARFHAEALDADGRLYYSEERFDDFYYGKGSTYPDAQGSIGILFEQASSRGHLRETRHGPLSFPFTIRNQLSTSFSTLRAAHELRDELLDYQREFRAIALQEASEEPVYAYVVDLEEDPARSEAFLDILERHQIRVVGLKEPIETEDGAFSPQRAVAIPMDQPQYRLARSLFERRRSFEDVTFYDVSTWNLAYSFGYRMGELKREALTGGGELWVDLEEPGDASPPQTLPEAYAYAVEWGRYTAPKTLARLLREGARVYVATEPFAAVTPEGIREFGYGTLVLPTGVPGNAGTGVRDALNEAGSEGGAVFPIQTGLTPQGVDLGSPSFEILEPMRVAMIVGSGVSAYEAGEAWHLLDHRYDMAVSLIDSSRARGVDWTEYTHLILVSGASGAFQGDDQERIAQWIRAGGSLIAIRGSVPFAMEVMGAEAEPPVPVPVPIPPTTKPNYADYEALRDRDLISGAIFQARVDRTHPLGYGFSRDWIPVFRNSEVVAPQLSDPFANVGVYTEEPWLCGYVSDRGLDRIRGSASVIGKRVGQGSVALMVDNPNFRGVWYGTNRFFANALFFSPFIKTTRDLWESEEEEP